MLFGFIDVEIAGAVFLALAFALLVIYQLGGADDLSSEDRTVGNRRSPRSGSDGGGVTSNDGCGGDGGGGGGGD